MTNDTNFLWYKLFQAEGFGPKSIHIIYRTIRGSGLSVEQIFKMDKSEFEHTFPDLGKGRLKKASFDAIQRQDEESLYEEYQMLKDNGIDIIFLGHRLYPISVLWFMKDTAPPVLFCKGELSLLKSEGISIVGSRNASDEGMKMAKQFAAELATQGKNVISGYARGIDTSTHLGALKKDGTTTIVLSFGILEFSKKRIFEDLRWKGNTLIVSQFHPGQKWNAGNAMIRNKLICALSKAVVIIEAGEQRDSNGKMSGAFDAGETALKMKIPLFIVSHNFFKNSPIGNRELVKRGGIEISPKDGIATLLKYLDTQGIKETKPVMTEKQMSFL